MYWIGLCRHQLFYWTKISTQPMTMVFEPSVLVTPPPPAAVFGRAIDDNEKATRCDLSNPNEIATRCDLSNSNEIATRCDLSNPNEIATRCDFNANDVGKMVFEPCVLSPLAAVCWG